MNLFHYIEDNEILLELFEELMTSMNQEILTFSSPVEYIKYTKSSEYRVPTAIFTDIKMPEMNGHQLIDKVKQSFPNMKFITLSGFDDTLQNRHKSACMHILKPFNPEVLEEIIDALLICDKQGPQATETICKELSLRENSISKKQQCPLQDNFLIR